MRKLYKHLLIFATSLLLVNCIHTELEDSRTKEGDEILLSSQSEGFASMARAVGNFPNDGSIGLFATTTYDPANPAITDWMAYDDINNARATATSVSNNVYSFAWDEVKYWPFDGTELYFIAYGPQATGADNNYLLSSDSPNLFIALQPAMHDVVYASDNVSPQAFNKTNATVDLGEFRHALSQLTIEIIADENMSPNIHATDLSIITTARSATLNLLQGDNGLSVTDTEIPYSEALLAGNVAFKSQKISRSQLLFPGTQEVTQVSLGLVDVISGSTFSRSYMMSFFTSDDPGQPITLQRGKNTILRIIVSGIGVEDPDQHIQLTGLVTDWDHRGRYGITIQ